MEKSVRTYLPSDNDDEEDERDAKIQISKPTHTVPVFNDEPQSTRATRLSFSRSDRATKRVIAPYVRVVRRGQQVKEEKEEENKEFYFYLQKKPSLLMRNLSAVLSDSVDLPCILRETAEVLKDITKSVGVALYMADETVGEIYHTTRTPINVRHRASWKIQPGKTVAAHVAYHKEYVMVDDILMDERFPEGVAYRDETIKSVLCVPVVTPGNECYAVIELCRDVNQPPFAREDLKIVIVVTGWLGTAIHQNHQRVALQKQQELNDYLLDLTKCYFANTVSMEKMISEVVSFAKVTLGAERGSFYIIDKDVDELTADLFEEGIDSSEVKRLYKKNLKVRLNEESGIPGYVARTGETVNIENAHADHRFNKESEEKSMLITRAMLCMPIMGVNGILGVVQLVNKKSGSYFPQVDEQLLQTFCLYCALALHYSRLSSLINKANNRNKCIHRMLEFHLKPCQHDLDNVDSFDETPVFPDGFTEMSWYVTPEIYHTLPQLVFFMIIDVIPKSEINQQPMAEFIYSVQKSYHNNPYHNFEHAFTVCHCMFNIVRRNKTLFSALEIKSLFLATLCHDLDHKGVTNNFLQLTNDNLAQLYEESYLENHHYFIAMTIISDCKLFKSLSDSDFKDMSKEIRELILATDLGMYFKSCSKLIQIWNEHNFDWASATHRRLMKGVMMTSCDLSAQCKPYTYAKKSTDCLYKEFYSQGDIEKKMGVCPLSMMDREKQHMVPEDQVQFLSVVVIPCTELMQMAMPNTKDLADGCRNLREVWKQIMEMRGQKMWRQCDTVMMDN